MSRRNSVPKVRSDTASLLTANNEDQNSSNENNK